MAILFLLPFFFLPIRVTYVSITSFYKKYKTATVINDFIIIIIAPLLTIFFGNQVLNISNNPWTEVNVNNALHAPIWPNAIPTFIGLVLS